ncbi:MAG: MMPL family transporter [Deltaproteobacteria bacterium]|jgi:predicted RND superfamily exporter protein|nr:MMPL family transporter [Deltaproteobacteria bacterium]
MVVGRFFQGWGAFIVKRPVLICLLLLAISIFLGWRVTKLKFDNSNDIWLEEVNPALQRLTEFRELFGNEDFVYLVFAGQDFFEPATVALLTELGEELKEKLPYVKTVRWLGDAEYLEGREGELVVASFADFSQPPATKEETRARVLREKIYQNLLFDQTGEVIGLSVDFEPYGDEVDPETKVFAAVSAVLANPKYQPLAARAVGPPILHTVYNQLSYSEAIKFLLLGLAVMVVILWALGRSAKDAIVPLMIIIISLVWAFGLTEFLGFKLNVFVILLPILLCCATVGDSTHIIELVRQARRAGSSGVRPLLRALGRSGAPCLITSLTSVAGFLSFYFSDIPPCREMGLYASIGIMTAYVLSLVIVPLFYANVKVSPEAAQGPLKKDIFDHFLAWLFRLNLAGRKIILALFGLGFVLATYGYLRVETESNTIGMLAPSLPLRQAYDFVDERLGGAMSVELIVDSFEPEGVKNPEFLAKMERLETFLGQRPEVTKTISVLDLLRNVSQALREGDPAFWVLPKTREAVAQNLLLYEMANGRELDKLVSFDSRQARLTARTKSLDTQEVRALTEAIQAKVREIFASPAAVTMTGGLDWTRSMNDQMALGQRQTFLAAFITLTVIMSLAMGSWWLGLLSLAPNVIPVLATIGLAGAVGIYIDIPLLCFSPIIIGLIIDDTTHFLYRFREAFNATGSYEVSLGQTLATVGRPLLFTTITVVGSFSFLLLSSLSGVSKFGGLGVVAFTLALVADFLLMPALLLTLKPFGPDRQATKRL